MSTIIDGLLFGWQKNLDYGERLVADLHADQMVQQPVTEGTPANHPAWILSHLNVYLPVIESLIRGEVFEDPRGHQFGMLSKPESSASVYPPREELVDAFRTGHERVAAALRECGADCFDQQVLLERWQQPMPTVGIALPYLMLVHENQHLGQLSAWRRVLGLPSV